QAVEQRRAEFLAADGVVAWIFGHVYVDAGFEFFGQVDAGAEGIVREREGGVRADQCGELTAASRAALFEITPVFGEAGFEACAAVAIGAFVAEDGSQADV